MFGPDITGVNSPYRKYAPFIRLCREEKAQTYDKWIYHSLTDLRPVGDRAIAVVLHSSFSLTNGEDATSWKHDSCLRPRECAAAVARLV
jgi:hypothetical protein